jgi:thiopeptide-type bacteriocin biosynthesis protein
MNKLPGWRIRVRDIQPELASRIFDELTVAGTITAWSTASYEPEAAAFGGTTGMDIAHDLFCADTSGILGYLLLESPPLGRHELSVLLINAMLDAAGLDWFERGDVFARVADMRPQPGSIVGQTVQLAAQLRALLALSAGATPFLMDGATARWRAAFTDAGGRFADAASSGTMTRGLRAVLAHAVIFHWNRLALPAATQAVLARACTAACLPGD